MRVNLSDLECTVLRIRTNKKKIEKRENETLEEDNKIRGEKKI